MRKGDKEKPPLSVDQPHHQTREPSFSPLLPFQVPIPPPPKTGEVMLAFPSKLESRLGCFLVMGVGVRRRRGKDAKSEEITKNESWLLQADLRPLSLPHPPPPRRARTVHPPHLRLGMGVGKPFALRIRSFPWLALRPIPGGPSFPSSSSSP